MIKAQKLICKSHKMISRCNHSIYKERGEKSESLLRTNLSPVISNGKKSFHRVFKKGKHNDLLDISRN